jgi:hypothetical protein
VCPEFVSEFDKPASEMSTAFGLSQHWQHVHEELSDVELVLKAEDDHADGNSTVLCRMPAHKLVISSSPWFKAQLRSCCK